MTLRAEIIEIVLCAVESLNDELPPASRVIPSESLALFGPDADLDSLSLVSVIIDVETALTIRFDEPVALTDDRAMSRDISPFTDVSALTDYILELLAERQAG